MSENTDLSNELELPIFNNVQFVMKNLEYSAEYNAYRGKIENYPTIKMQNILIKNINDHYLMASTSDIIQNTENDILIYIHQNSYRLFGIDCTLNHLQKKIIVSKDTFMIEFSNKSIIYDKDDERMTVDELCSNIRVELDIELDSVIFSKHNFYLKYILKKMKITDYVGDLFQNHN